MLADELAACFTIPPGMIAMFLKEMELMPGETELAHPLKKWGPGILWKLILFPFKSSEATD